MLHAGGEVAGGEVTNTTYPTAHVWLGLPVISLSLLNQYMEVG